MSTFAVISIGTNSTRLLIARRRRDGRLAPFVQRSIGTRLGAGLREHGRLDPEAVRRTLDVVDDYAQLVRSHEAALGGIATSAMRRADDADAFAAEVERRIGVPLEVIGGDREAALSFRGATATHYSPDRVGVVDVGGGSADYACGLGGAVEATVSCEIGAVRLSEAIPGLLGVRAPVDPAALEAEARAFARDVLAPLAATPRVSAVYAVGGTMFNAAAMLRDTDEIDGVTLGRAELAEFAARFLAMPARERRAERRISPQRADIFPAGLLIVDECLGLLGVDATTVSRADLLYGYLVERFAQ